MGALINDTLLSEIKSLYPYLKITPFTRQQEMGLHAYLSGGTATAAARAAGYGSPTTFKTFLETDKAQAVLTYFSEKEQERINITRDRLTMMALECYGERSTAAEGLKAVEVLARMHGKNEEAKQKKTEVSVNVDNRQVHVSGESPAALKKKLEQMSSEQLIQHASSELSQLDLEPTPIKEVTAEVIEDNPSD